jgi:sugar phosphate isomerase/epimerase
LSHPTLRFLADESCDFAVVRALRAKGYDVLAVSEVTQRSDDRELIKRAAKIVLSSLRIRTSAG